MKIKNVILQSLTCLIIYLLCWVITHLIMDVIAWSFIYLLILGYLAFIILTSRYNWLVTMFQFIIVGLISFITIGYLYNEVYEPYVEQNFPMYEPTMAGTIGIIELIVIKLLSDNLLRKAKIKQKKSLIERILPSTKSTSNAG